MQVYSQQSRNSFYSNMLEHIYFKLDRIAMQDNKPECPWNTRDHLNCLLQKAAAKSGYVEQRTKFLHSGNCVNLNSSVDTIGATLDVNCYSCKQTLSKNLLASVYS